MAVRSARPSFREGGEVDEAHGRVLTVAAFVMLLLIVSAIPAFAEANPNASSLGTGGSTETANFGAGARADISHEVINVFAPEAGTTPRGVYRDSAHEHGGSVEACFG